MKCWQEASPEEGMVNHSIRVKRWPRRAGPPTARTAAAVIATAALALLAAACGSGSSAGSGGASHAGGSQDSQLLAFSRCMRSHGVPKFPDPTMGVVPRVQPGQLGVSSAQMTASARTCQHLLPSGPHEGPPQTQNLVRYQLDVARCMRAHGIPFRDPPRPGSAADLGSGPPAVPRSVANSPQFLHAMPICVRQSNEIVYGNPNGPDFGG
jgi:hypothetical protein